MEPDVSIESGCMIRIAVLPIGAVPQPWWRGCVSRLVRHRKINLSAISSCYMEHQKSPFTHQPWNTGTLRFQFMLGDGSTSPWEDFQSNRKILAVIGLCHCLLHLRLSSRPLCQRTTKRSRSGGKQPSLRQTPHRQQQPHSGELPIGSNNPTSPFISFSDIPSRATEPGPEKMNNQLQELERQLLDDNDDESSVSAVTSSEWSETIQNLIAPKPLSPSPTTSSLSSSSPPSSSSKQLLLDSSAAILKEK